MEEDRRKNSLWALLLTLLITVGTLALLMNFTLRYEQDPNLPDMTHLMQDSILFGGEFVMLGNTMEALQNDLMDQESSDPSASPEEGDDPDIDADDMEDAGQGPRRRTTNRSRSPRPKTARPRPKRPSPKTPPSRKPRRAALPTTR